MFKILKLGANRVASTFFAKGSNANEHEREGSDLAVILNSNEEACVTPNLLRLLLQAIFAEQVQLATDFYSALLPQLSATTNVCQVESLIESMILQRLQSPKTEDKLAASLFFQHKLRAGINEEAYSKTGKTNPSGVFWPNPLSTPPRNIHDDLPFVCQTPIINKKTAITSLGSCFAMEIAAALQSEGYNYVVKESNHGPEGDYSFKDGHPTIAASSAAWGILFNCPSFRQIVEKSFGLRNPAKILWSHQNEGTTKYCDPFREEIEFPTPQAFERNYESHRNAARAAFLEAEVLIITLGLNEVWYFRPDGSAFSRSPWRTAPSFVEHRTLTVEENVRELQRMLDVLREYNPDLKVVVTLSPVPLHATFQANRYHVIEANCHSKAVLRVAAQEFVEQNSDVYYFPSYELVTSCSANPWAEDQRHINKPTVHRIMSLFKHMYCEQ